MKALDAGKEPYKWGSFCDLPGAESDMCFTFKQIHFGLDTFFLEVLIKIWQIFSKHLLVEPQADNQVVFVKLIELHQTIRGHQIREAHKCVVLVHVEEEKARDVAHALYVPDIWPGNREGAHHIPKVLHHWAVDVEHFCRRPRGKPQRDLRICVHINIDKNL